MTTLGPIPYSEFAPSLDAEIGDAVLRLFRDDAALRGFMTSIEDYEAEDIFLASSNLPPSLGVILEGTLRERWGSNKQGRITTDIGIALMLPRNTTLGTQRWLRSRLVGHIYQLIESTDGVLYDEAAEPITEALLEFARVGVPTQLPTGPLLVRLVARFRSHVRNPTGEFIHGQE